MANVGAVLGIVALVAAICFNFSLHKIEEGIVLYTMFRKLMLTHELKPNGLMKYYINSLAVTVLHEYSSFNNITIQTLFKHGKFYVYVGQCRILEKL